MKYQKPSIFVLNESVFFNANAQYVLNITDQWCHGDACGEPKTIELATGTDLYDDDCIDSGEDPTGDYMDLKCLETGNEIHHMVVVGYTYGGTETCGIDQTPVIIHFAINPGFPEVCTVTAEINEKGEDQCQQSCK